MPFFLNISFILSSGVLDREGISSDRTVALPLQMRPRREFGQGGRRAGGGQEVLLFFVLRIYHSFLSLPRLDRGDRTFSDSP